MTLLLSSQDPKALDLISNHLSDSKCSFFVFSTSKPPSLAAIDEIKDFSQTLVTDYESVDDFLLLGKTFKELLIVCTPDQSEKLKEKFSNAKIQELATFTSPSNLFSEFVLLGAASSKKSVTSVCTDSSGSRIFNGSVDCSVKLWDFHSTTVTDGVPFREIRPLGEHRIRQLEFSPFGNQLLLAIGEDCCAKLLSKDGATVGETVRGDMYLKDFRNTRGHVSALVCGDWSPAEEGRFLTAGCDGTVRLWSVTDLTRHLQIALLKEPGTAKAASIATARFESSGNSVLVALRNGMLLKLSGNRLQNQTRVLALSDPIFFLKIFGNVLAVRTSSGVQLVVDYKMDKFLSASAQNELCGCEFSPDASKIVVGDAGDCTICVFSISSGCLLQKFSFPKHHPSFATCFYWSPRINQLIVGGSDGCLLVAFDRNSSLRGAMLMRSIKSIDMPKNDFFCRLDKESQVVGEKIYTPYSLPLSKDVSTPFPHNHHHQESFPRNSQRPVAPVLGAGSGGRIGSSANAIILKRNIDQYSVDEDPREELLKYAEDAEKNPYWALPAYRKNQSNLEFTNHAKNSKKEK